MESGERNFILFCVYFFNSSTKSLAGVAGVEDRASRVALCLCIPFPDLVMLDLMKSHQPPLHLLATEGICHFGSLFLWVILRLLTKLPTQVQGSYPVITEGGLVGPVSGGSPLTSVPPALHLCHGPSQLSSPAVIGARPAHRGLGPQPGPFANGDSGSDSESDSPPLT